MTARVRPLFGQSMPPSDTALRDATRRGWDDGERCGYVAGWRWGVVCGGCAGVLLGMLALWLALQAGMAAGVAP